MTNFSSRDTVAKLRESYPQGMRVELVVMDDPYTTLRPGDRGRVNFVDDGGTVHITWDSGSTLGAVYGVDQIKKVTDEKTLPQPASTAPCPIVKKQGPNHNRGR